MSQRIYPGRGVHGTRSRSRMSPEPRRRRQTIPGPMPPIESPCATG